MGNNMKQPCLFLVGLGMAQHCPRAMAFLEEIHSTFPFLCPGNLLGQEFGSASVSHLQFFSSTVNTISRSQPRILSVFGYLILILYM